MAETRHKLFEYVLLVFVLGLIFFIPHSALALKCCKNEPGSFSVTPTVNIDYNFNPPKVMLNLSGTVTGGECSCACIIGMNWGRFEEEDGDPLSTVGGELKYSLDYEVTWTLLTKGLAEDWNLLQAASPIVCTIPETEFYFQHVPYIYEIHANNIDVSGLSCDNWHSVILRAVHDSLDPNKFYQATINFFIPCRNENCCDNSGWNNATRCGGCCGPAANCVAYDFSAPYNWHRSNEVWRCQYAVNQNSIYHFVENCEARGAGWSCQNGSCAYVPPANNPPNVPVLTSPPNNTWINYAYPTFKALVSDPDNNDVHAYFEITGFGTGTGSTVTSGGTSYWGPVPGISDGDTWWRADAQDSQGATSAWSGSWLMLKDSVKPIATIDQDNGNHPDLGIHIVAGGTDDRSGIAEGDGEGRRNSLIAPAPSIEKFGNDCSATNMTCVMAGNCTAGGTSYIGSCTDNVYFDYIFNFPNATNYSAGLITANSGELRDLGRYHHINVYLDGTLKGSFNNPAANTPIYQMGRVSLGSVTVGNHTVRYEWKDDGTGLGGDWNAGSRDSNLLIYKAFIDDWVDAPTLNVVSYNADYTVGGFGNTYEFRYRVKDNAGNWSDWAYDGSVTPSTFQSLSVGLTANKTTGPAPLTGVALTANVGGSAAGNINYTFYCNRGDMIPTAGLVGYWKFDENSGTAVQDFSTSAANGTWAGTGTHWTTGKIRSAGDFNGTDDLVSMGDVLDIIGTSGMTISAWVKVDTFKDWGMIADKLVTGGNYRFFTNADRSVEFGIRNTANGYESVKTAAAVLNAGQWYHLVATFNDVNTGKIYINGNPNPSATKSNFTLVRGNTTEALKFGRTNNNSVNFDGALDEIRIYNRVLSAVEITQLYNYIGTQITLPADHELDNTSINPYSAPATTCDTVYGSPGSYTAKVIAERGGLAAENWLPITVTNTPPTADTFGVVNSDFCAPNVNYSFSWIYRDPNSDTESRYDFQIATNVGFNNVVVSRSFSGLSNPINTTNSQAVLVVPQNPPPADYLTYNATYYWRVRVWDNQGANSGWLPQPPIPFNPPHRYPVCDFTYSPQYPNVKEKVDFTDSSTCYDDVSTGAACAPTNGDTFTWTFPNGTPANSSAESPQDVIFDPYGVKNVVLTVNDGLFSCSKTIPVNIRFPLPSWKEIKPQ